MQGLEIAPYIENSPFGFLPPLVPVLVSQHLLDVQLVATGPVILRDPVDQHRDLGNRGIHAVEKP
jgi:hypothetical protein